MNIRNFVIIAHVDHGKSTLADRLLEVTGTVESRRMRPQYLDQLDLERERGITIKMAPVRMRYSSGGEDYILNLIDTPGHSDFAYEVSRALAAVEGAILLVDATKGIQAQTLSNYRQAKASGLEVVGAVNKIDIAAGRADQAVLDLAGLLETDPSEIFRISGKTGEGVAELLKAVIRRVPPPQKKDGGGRALIFDSLYDDHKGILAYVRVREGTFRPFENSHLMAADTDVRFKEVGYFLPQLRPAEALGPGEIGYFATGLKEPALVKIGDTVVCGSRGEALPGYREAAPVVFISFYPDQATEFDDLKRAFERLRLTDAALSFEPDANEALGRGLKVGFLGKLHFEITATRLTREFNLDFLTSFPSIAYRVMERGGSRIVSDAHDFPENPDKVFQPMIKIELLTPSQYLNPVLNLQRVFDFTVEEVKNLGEHVLLLGRMPLMELIRDFDDQLKSASAGFASFSYELAEEAESDVEKLEILVAGEVVPALTRVVFRKDIEREGRATVDRLKKLLPGQQFSQAIQARVRGRIIARETIPALKKKLGDFGKNSGDRTRKMKLWQKQKRGKEKLQQSAKVNISAEVFREILKK
ncbi:MAG: Elongation factor 4 [Parcubacteria group bacterium GW2011_GWA1_59_11]|nr:MAG: Elongation factor 4 [Parcubacteria group bacterium GW2011_GWA1_59_11]